VEDAGEGIRRRVRPKPGSERFARRVAELLERRDPCRDQRLRLRAAQAGNEREVVVVDALLRAQVPEVADAAVPARPAVGHLPRLEHGEIPLADAAVVRLEVDDAERLARAEPVLDVDALDGAPLEASDLLGVEQQLQDVRRLGTARELGVDGLVAAAGPALEEVGEAAPAAILAHEVGLVDDVRHTGVDRLLGELSRLVRVELLVVVGRDPDDRAAGGDEAGQEGGLVLVPFPEDQVAVR